MTDTEKEITKTITSIGDKLNNEYLKAGTMSKQKRIVYDLYAYVCLFDELFEKEPKYIWNINEDLIPTDDNFINILNRDKKYFLELSKSVINSFISEDYSLYKDYYKKLPKLNYNEMIDILMSFLKDFDNDIYLKLSNKGKEGKIIETQINYYGYVLPFESIKDSVIVINNDSDIYNLSFMSTLAHECGHLFEIEHLYSQDNITFRRDSMSSIYCEVSSTFFEYAFLRYLEDNKIFENSVNLVLNEYYMKLFIHNFYINLISMKKNINSIDGYVYIKEENISKYADYIIDKVNFYNMLSYKYGLDYRNIYIYGIGYLFAIHMYEKYKEDKEYFKNELKKSFLVYPNDSSLEAFKNIGINYEELKSGKLLRKTLRNR